MAAASGSTARGTWWRASGQWRWPCPARIQRQRRRSMATLAVGVAWRRREDPGRSRRPQFLWIYFGFLFSRADDISTHTRKIDFCVRVHHLHEKVRFSRTFPAPHVKTTFDPSFFPTSEVPILSYFTQLLPLIRKQVDRIKLDGDWLLKHTQTSIELRCTSANLGTTGLDTWTQVFFSWKNSWLDYRVGNWVLGERNGGYRISMLL